MPIVLKIVAYFLILFVLALISNAIPKSGEPFKGLFAFLCLFWGIGGVFIIFRAAYRFITR